MKRILVTVVTLFIVLPVFARELPSGRDNPVTSVLQTRYGADQPFYAHPDAVGVVMDHSLNYFSSGIPIPYVMNRTLLTGDIKRIRVYRTIRLIHETDLFNAPVNGEKSGNKDWIFPLLTYRGEF